VEPEKFAHFPREIPKAYNNDIFKIQLFIDNDLIEIKIEYAPEE
jgi:hypothetical protein